MGMSNDFKAFVTQDEGWISAPILTAGFFIRVLKVSAAAPEIDKAAQLQQEMGHSSSMQKKYISR